MPEAGELSLFQCLDKRLGGHQVDPLQSGIPTRFCKIGVQRSP